MRDELKDLFKLFVTAVAGMSAILILVFIGVAICVVGYAAITALNAMLLGGAA